MNLSFELFVSGRYLWGQRKEAFISAISRISVAGVAIGVMALIVVIAVMNGFSQELKEKILGSNAHVYVEMEGGLEDYSARQEDLKNYPQVKAVSPYVFGQALIRYQDNIRGVMVKGIDYPAEVETTSFGDYFYGERARLVDKGIVLGEELRRNLNVLEGERITLVSPNFVFSPLGSVPQLAKFDVVGFFRSGMYEHDANMAYVSIAEAQRIFGYGDRITGLALRLFDLDQANAFSLFLRNELGFPFVVKSWIEANRNLFAALQLEKKAMFVILTLIVVVAAFNIIGTLIMITMEKTRDIGILRALGASRRSVVRIFILIGFSIGFIGTVLGCAGGYFLAMVIEKYQLIKLSGDIYYIDYLPARISLWEISAIALAALAISLAATVYPSLKAARLNMIEAIRYE